MASDFNRDPSRFAEEGYVVVERLLGPEHVAELNDVLDRVPKVQWNPFRFTANERTLLAEGPVRDIFTRSRYFDVLAQVLGPDVQLLDLQLLEIAPQDGHERDWHVDFTFFSTPTLVCNFGIYLAEMTLEQGPLYVVPGSHRWHREPEPDDVHRPHPDEVALVVPAGSAVAFDGQLWHTGSRNATDRPRRGLFAYSSHYWMKRMDEFYERPLPSAILESEDPRVRQLFGLELMGESVHGASYRRGHPAFV